MGSRRVEDDLALAQNRPDPDSPLLKRTWYISDVDLFRGLTPAEVDAWVAECEVRRFRAGERIIDARSTLPEQVLVIQAGAVRFLQEGARGRPQTVEVLGPGRLFGVSCAFGPTTRSLHADALTPVVVCAAEGRGLLAALARGPQIVLNLVRQVGAGVVHLDGQPRLPAGRPASLRLVAVLDRLAAAAGQAVAGGQRLPACVSRTTLAYQTGCTRETVARLLADLEAQRCIRREKRALIVDPECLQQQLSAASGRRRPAGATARRTSPGEQARLAETGAGPGRG